MTTNPLSRNWLDLVLGPDELRRHKSWQYEVLASLVLVTKEFLHPAAASGDHLKVRASDRKPFAASIQHSALQTVTVGGRE